MNISRHLYHEIQNISGENELKILDIGCGSGDYSIVLANKLQKAKYYCVDISSEALYKLKENLKKGTMISADPFLKEFSFNVNIDNFHTELTDGINLPYDDNSFDFIYFVMILHHTYEYEKIIKEAIRVLKTGGKIVIIDLKGQSNFEHILIKNIFKLIPKSIKIKLFANDLMLEDGEIPLRSDVSYKKIVNICKSLNLSICNEVFNGFRLYTPLILLSKLMGNKAFKFFKPLLASLIYSERFFRSTLKNQFDVYFISLTKNND